MDASEIVELAAKNGLDDRESLVSFALGFAAGATDRDADDPVHLYGTPESHSTICILAFLFDAGIPFQFEMVDVMKDEHRRPDFVAMNPYVRVPVIDHGGYVLNESSAILRYLCRAFPTAASKFYGNGDIQVQGFIDAALDERQLGVLDAARPVIYPAMGFMPKPTEKAVARAMEVVTARLQVFCDHFLKHGRFVGGDHPSIADYSLASILHSFRCAPELDKALRRNAALVKYIDDFEEAAPGWAKAIDGSANGIGLGALQFYEKRAETWGDTPVGSHNGAS